MTKKFNFKKIFFNIIFFSVLLQSVFSQNTNLESGELKKWTVAAEKFTFSKGQKKSSVNEGIAEAIPKNILESLNHYLLRNIKPDEELERLRYDLRKKRQSLYLQLSGEYQKRDVLSLSNTGDKLNKLLKEQNEKIKDIEKKIDENIKEMETAEVNEEQRISQGLEDYSGKKNPMESLFNKIINDDKAVVKSEEIRILNDDSDYLFVPSKELKLAGYESSLFSEEMHKKGINSYLTGEITIFGGYISVSVNVYVYPGGKKAGSVMEVGSFRELDFVVSSVASQLTAILTNSIPVAVNFFIESYDTQDIQENIKLYIDDTLQNNMHEGRFFITSGVHTFQIVAEGYKSLATSYYFEGNTEYDIRVNLEREEENTLFITSNSSVPGDIFTNNILSEKIDSETSKIIINDSEILGCFVSENGETDYFYIPDKLFYNQDNVVISPNIIDKDEYIEQRRRWMYGSYSAFVVSLIPTFITSGYYSNQRSLFKSESGHGSKNAVIGWSVAANVFGGISIGLGAFWVFELVRYLLSADYILPQKAKSIEIID